MIIFYLQLFIAIRGQYIESGYYKTLTTELKGKYSIYPGKYDEGFNVWGIVKVLDGIFQRS